MLRKAKEGITDAWYAADGKEQDVVVSSRATLSRNLANFPFPVCLSDSDSERVQSIIFDAFNFFDNAEDYQAISVSKLDDIGSKIMRERGVLFFSEGHKSGLVIRNDGKISCTINTDDHVKISSFESGLGVEGVFNAVYSVDSKLQKKVQFAASHDFGYLTYMVMDSGSGLVMSSELHLPALSLLNLIKHVSTNVIGSEFNFLETYGAGGAKALSGFGGGGASLGCYYNVVSKNSAGGTELDQMTSMQCVLQNVIKEERNARKTCKAEHMSEIINYAYRALAMAQNSLFITLREAIEIISGVKFGKDVGVLSGIEDNELHSLLYRIQEGHLEYVLNNGRFKFEKDIQDNRRRKIERLRALVLQEAFEKVKK